AIASQGGGTTTYNANNANQYTSVTGLTPITHDANGNLLLQNNVSYTWDSENRLLSVTPNTPAIGDKSLVHTYDGQHRRVTRTIREWTATGWSNTATTHFIYDGWNLIEEYQLNTLNSVLVRNFTWGQDLGGSTSLQAAGGVGGLIMVEEINGITTTAYHFHYDGNGNVIEVTDLNGNSAASYRYDAFGNTLVSTGSYAASNRYRFSTKPLDHEVTSAPLYYYGYRYYDPVTGRWPSRDPIEEEGGINLYAFCYNASQYWHDYLGREPKVTRDANGRWRDAGGRYTNTPSSNVSPANSIPTNQNGASGPEDVGEAMLDRLSSVSKSLARKQAEKKCAELFETSGCEVKCPKSCTWAIAGTRGVQGGSKPVDQWYLSGATVKCKSCKKVASEKPAGFYGADQHYYNQANEAVKGNYAEKLGPETGCING
ncbi:MAG: hypothetical protein RLZZ245_2300, partial [Verrucomicrobiota bacterium]